MILWACSNCHAKLRVPDTMIGRKLPCPRCQALNEVPDSSSLADESLDQMEATTENGLPTKLLDSSQVAWGETGTATTGASGFSFRIIAMAVMGLVAVSGLLAGGYALMSRSDSKAVAEAPVAAGQFAGAPVPNQPGVMPNQAGVVPNMGIPNGNGLNPVAGGVKEGNPGAGLALNAPPANAPAARNPVNPAPPAGNAKPVPEVVDTSSGTYKLVEAYNQKMIEARVTFEDAYERPFKGVLELKPGIKAPGGLKVSGEIGDCIAGFLLTEPVQAEWLPGDRAPKSFNVKVLGFHRKQISMARAERILRSGVWKGNALSQMILRNEELRTAGDAVWQLAVARIEPEGDFRRHRDEFANTPYEVTNSQWKFVETVLQKLRPLALQIEQEEKSRLQAATAASAVRIPLLTAIGEQRITPRFAFTTLLDPQFSIDFKVSPGEENRRLEMWAPEAISAVVETKPGEFRTFFLCGLELSTSKVTKNIPTNDFTWAGVAYSATPFEPEPINSNALYEYFVGRKLPQFGEIEPVVAHIAANQRLDPVKKQLAIWLHHNPTLSHDTLKALGQKYDHPILATLPESILVDARAALRTSQWQVERLPEELRKGRLNDYFVGVWKPTEFIHARAAAVNFQLPETLQNPYLPPGELDRFRQQFTQAFSSGIKMEDFTLTLFPDLRFEARGSHRDSPVAAQGNWRWDGARLEFPLWKDGKGNDPFLESGGRANLPMEMLVDGNILGERLYPDGRQQPRGAFLRKTSTDPGLTGGVVAATDNTTADNPATAAPRPETPATDDPLQKALHALEIQNQAAKADAQNTRVRTLYDAVQQGLVSLTVEVVEPLPKPNHFMHKEAAITIRRLAPADRLNLQLLCAAPMQLEFESIDRVKVPALVCTARPQPIELPANMQQVEISARCFPLQWERLHSLKSLSAAVPGEINPQFSFLAASYGGVYISGSLAEIAEFYGEHWEKIQQEWAREDQQLKAKKAEAPTIASALKSRQRFIDDIVTFKRYDILGRIPGFEVDRCAREMGTAALFLQNPTWKAEQLVRYAHTPAVAASQVAVTDPQYQLSSEFSLPEVYTGARETRSVRMGLGGGTGHSRNFKSYLLAKYCREEVARMPQLLRTAKTPNACDSHFIGRWKSIDNETAAKIVAQITPRTGPANEAWEFYQRHSQDGAVKVGVLATAVSLMDDHSFVRVRDQDGADEEISGAWQWDGSQLWIGDSAYQVFGDYLVQLKYNPGTVWGVFLEREGRTASMPEQLTASTPATPMPGESAPLESKNTAAPMPPEKQNPAAPGKGKLTKLTPDAVIGEWKAASEDQAVVMRLAVMRQKVEVLFGNGKLKLNDELKANKELMLAQALTEAGKDLRIPEIEFRLEANKTFQFKSLIQGAESEATGKWSISSGKLVLQKDKFTRLEFVIIEGGLYGESIPFGETYLSKSEP